MQRGIEHVHAWTLTRQASSGFGLPSRAGAEPLAVLERGERGEVRGAGERGSLPGRAGAAAGSRRAAAQRTCLRGRFRIREGQEPAPGPGPGLTPPWPSRRRTTKRRECREDPAMRPLRRSPGPAALRFAVVRFASPSLRLR